MLVKHKSDSDVVLWQMVYYPTLPLPEYSRVYDLYYAAHTFWACAQTVLCSYSSRRSLLYSSRWWFVFVSHRFHTQSLKSRSSVSCFWVGVIWINIHQQKEREEQSLKLALARNQGSYLHLHCCFLVNTVSSWPLCFRPFLALEF